MKNQKNAGRLTESEYQVMDLLWESDGPLTTSEIVSSCKDKIWKDSYIFVMISSLEKKGMIEVADFVKSGKRYSRAFRAGISKERYAVRTLPENIDRKELLFRVADMVATDTEIVDIMLMAVEERKKEILEESV